MVSEPLSFSFPYRPDQHAGAILEAPRYRVSQGWSRAFAVAMLFFGLVVTISNVADEKPLADLLREAGVWLGLATFWWIAPSMLRRYTRWSLARKRATGDGTELRVFSDDGFLGSSDWAQPVPWFLVDRVVETPNFFLVYSTNTEPSWVPKAELKPADMDHLRELFQRHSTRVSKSLLDRQR
jgi:hypothetical protein